MRALPVVVFLVLTVGCDTSPNPTDAGFDSGGEVDAFVPSDAGPTVRVRGTVQAITGGAVAGAVVSDALHPSVGAATTDVDGVFALEVPAGVPLQIEIAMTGWLTSIFPAPPATVDVDMAMLGIGQRIDIDVALVAASITSEPGQGAISLRAFSRAPDGAAGVTFVSGASELSRVYYDTGGSMPGLDPDRVSTSPAGIGFALTEVLSAPTTIDVTASAGGRDCVAPMGWQSTAGTDTFAAPVRPDAVTFVAFECPPPAGLRTVFGHVNEYIPGMPLSAGDPLPDVAVCLLDSTMCVATDANGDYVFDVPESADFALTYDVAGRDSVLVPLRAGTMQIMRNVGMPEGGYVETTALAYGVTQTPSDGSIEFFTTGPGVTVTMTSGTSDGPHYFGPSVTVDTTLTATSSQAWGFLFAATPAASVDILFEHMDSTRPCVAIGDTAWTSPTPETIRAPVVAGYTTFVSLRCP